MRRKSLDSVGFGRGHRDRDDPEREQNHHIWLDSIGPLMDAFTPFTLTQCHLNGCDGMIRVFFFLDESCSSARFEWIILWTMFWVCCQGLLVIWWAYIILCHPSGSLVLVPQLISKYPLGSPPQDASHHQDYYIFLGSGCWKMDDGLNCLYVFHIAYEVEF